MRLLSAGLVGALVAAGCGDDALDQPDASVDAAPPLPGLIAVWNFDERQGVTVFDSSGVEPAVDLEIFNFNNVTWGTEFLRFDEPTIARSVGPATKITESLMAANQLSIEVWVRTDGMDQGEAAIVSLGRDASNHNTYLGTLGLRYRARVRVNAADINGDSLDTDVDAIDTDLTHIVHTHSALERRLYVDGVVAASETIEGDYTSWAAEHQLSVGGEPNQDGNRAFRGEIHRIAIYERMLSGQDVVNSFVLGPSP